MTVLQEHSFMLTQTPCFEVETISWIKTNKTMNQDIDLATLVGTWGSWVTIKLGNITSLSAI